MKLLLDTHIWIWSLLDPDQLKPAVRRALLAPKTELWLSPISVWELMILAERGRVRLGTEIEAWLTEAQRLAPVREAPLTREIAVASRRVPLAHEDPADRFLVATASVLDLTLVTHDARILAAQGIATLSNR